MTLFLTRGLNKSEPRYVYMSRKIGSKIKPKEEKLPIVIQLCVVYYFQCDTCVMHQLIEEYIGDWKPPEREI